MCRSPSKIEERGTHSIDRLVERKTLERDSVLERFDMDQNIQRQCFFLHRWAGYIAKSGTDTQTAVASRTGGLQR